MALLKKGKGMIQLKIQKKNFEFEIEKMLETFLVTLAPLGKADIKVGGEKPRKISKHFSQ